MAGIIKKLKVLKRAWRIKQAALENIKRSAVPAMVDAFFYELPSAQRELLSEKISKKVKIACGPLTVLRYKFSKKKPAGFITPTGRIRIFPRYAAELPIVSHEVMHAIQREKGGRYAARFELVPHAVGTYFNNLERRSAPNFSSFVEIPATEHEVRKLLDLLGKELGKDFEEFRKLSPTASAKGVVKLVRLLKAGELDAFLEKFHRIKASFVRSVIKMPKEELKEMEYIEKHSIPYGTLLGRHALKFEKKYGVPGSGIFFIKLVHDGMTVTDAEEAIRKGKLDKEIQEWFSKHAAAIGGGE